MTNLIIEEKLGERFHFTAIQFGEGGAFEVALWHGKFPIPLFFWAHEERNVSKEHEVWRCSNIKIVERLQAQAKDWAENQNPECWGGGK